MRRSSSRLSSSSLTKLAVLLLAARSAYADSPAPSCRVVDVEFTPTTAADRRVGREAPRHVRRHDLHHAADRSLTASATGPGRFDFNSGPTEHDVAVRPAHHDVPGVGAPPRPDVPEVVFQNGDENDLSTRSTRARARAPLLPADACRREMPAGIRHVRVARVHRQGRVLDDARRRCIRRAPTSRAQAGSDSPSVDMYKALNPFDAVSQATPIGGSADASRGRSRRRCRPATTCCGSRSRKEFDFNATYNATTVSVADRHLVSRRTASRTAASRRSCTACRSRSARRRRRGDVASYAGYGDPTGSTARQPPDATITTDTPGSGASRLAARSPTATRHVSRRASTRSPSATRSPPAPRPRRRSTDVDERGDAVVRRARRRRPRSATRHGLRDPLPRERRDDRRQLRELDAGDGAVTPSAPRRSSRRSSSTACCRRPTTGSASARSTTATTTADVAIVQVTTADAQSGEVDACFVATAAYGSLMANDVEMLRHFRDALLRTTVLGELAVEAYYTFGPARRRRGRRVGAAARDRARRARADRRDRARPR